MSRLGLPPLAARRRRGVAADASSPAGAIVPGGTEIGLYSHSLFLPPSPMYRMR